MRTVVLKISCSKYLKELALFVENLPVGLYCIVVGSQRLMPPDALQPKAYCKNPGL